MAYSPLTDQVLAANNAETPAYGNLFSTTSGHPPVTLTPRSPITKSPCPQAKAGSWPAAWSSRRGIRSTGTFFVSIPQLGTGAVNDPGGVAEINTTGTVLRTISFANLGITSCSPTGLAVGASGNLLVGCGNVGAAAILLDPTGAGSIVKTFAGLGGTDELWYDPTTNAFYVTGNDGTNATRFFDIVTDNGAASIISQTVDLPTTTSAHSITVDPFNGDVFRGARRHHRAGSLPGRFRQSGLHRGIRPGAGAGQLAAARRWLGGADGHCGGASPDSVAVPRLEPASRPAPTTRSASRPAGPQCPPALASVVDSAASPLDRDPARYAAVSERAPAAYRTHPACRRY